MKFLAGAVFAAAFMQAHGGEMTPMPGVTVQADVIVVELKSNNSLVFSQNGNVKTLPVCNGQNSWTIPQIRYALTMPRPLAQVKIFLHGSPCITEVVPLVDVREVN